MCLMKARNGAMPVPVPNIVGMLPGMTAMATRMMNGWMEKANVAKVSELLNIALESDVRMIGCQMTMDLFEYEQKDMIDGIKIGGAATYMENAINSDINLFI